MPTTKRRPSASRGSDRRARGSLSREEIVRGAFALAERDGLHGLSMPRLARHIGVGVTSLYWYFHSKEDLLATLTEVASARMLDLLPPRHERDWDEHLARFFHAMRRVYLDHPVLCDLIVLRPPTQADSPAAMGEFRRLLDREIASLVDAGFPLADAVNAYLTLSFYTRASVLDERLCALAAQRADHAAGAERAGAERAGVEPADVERAGAEWAGSGPGGAAPAGAQGVREGLPAAVRVAARYLTAGSPAEETFEAGVGTIIRGLRVRLAEATPARPWQSSRAIDAPEE